MIKSKWLFSKKLDLTILFIPVWLIWIWAFGNKERLDGQDLPLWAWVVFIIFLDVSHVWSTLYRSYFNTNDRSKHKKRLLWTPLIAFPVLAGVAMFSVQLFWGLMAYFAIYHFMKQQYGFMALYLYKNKSDKKLVKHISDKLVIYVSMLYPVLFWHFDNSRNFNWFIEGDFIPVHLVFDDLSIVFEIGNWLYFIFIAIWLGEELWGAIRNNQKIVWGKILWVLTTALNWYLGIVYFNSDYVFSITNVVAHGVPYIALVMYYNWREMKMVEPRVQNNHMIFKIGLMLTSILFIAFFEEYLWDMLVNQEHQLLFETIVPFWVEFNDSPLFQGIFIGLLALPQVVHYLLDGFIWKMDKFNPKLKMILTDE